VTADSSKLPKLSEDQSYRQSWQSNDVLAFQKFQNGINGFGGAAFLINAPTASRLAPKQSPADKSITEAEGLGKQVEAHAVAATLIMHQLHGRMEGANLPKMIGPDRGSEFYEAKFADDTVKYKHSLDGKEDSLSCSSNHPEQGIEAAKAAGWKAASIDPVQLRKEELEKLLEEAKQKEMEVKDQKGESLTKAEDEKEKEQEREEKGRESAPKLTASR
jgi:hypothetical protein